MKKKIQYNMKIYIILFILEVLFLVIYKIGFSIEKDGSYLHKMLLDLDFNFTTSLTGNITNFSSLFLGYIISLFKNITYRSEKLKSIRNLSITISLICIFSLLNEIIKLIFNYGVTFYFNFSILIIIFDIILFITFFKFRVNIKLKSYISKTIIITLIILTLFYTSLSIFYSTNSLNKKYELTMENKEDLKNIVENVFSIFNVDKFFLFSVEELKTNENITTLISIFNELNKNYVDYSHYNIKEYEYGNDSGKDFIKYIIEINYLNKGTLYIELILRKDNDLWKIFIFNVLN